MAEVVGLPTFLPGCLMPRAVLLAPFITLGRQSSQLSQHRLVGEHKIIEAFKTVKKNTSLRHFRPACLQIVRNWLRNLLTPSQYGRVSNHLYVCNLISTLPRLRQHQQYWHKLKTFNGWHHTNHLNDKVPTWYPQQSVATATIANTLDRKTFGWILTSTFN